MDVRNVSPFLDAISKVMPQLGFQNIVRGRISVAEGEKMASLGVMVVIGLTDQLRGNVAYNMTEASARKIASTMMMGMPVETMDAMAESAIAELGNMLSANAAMIFETQGNVINISPPTLITGQSHATMAGSKQRLVVEVIVDDIPIEVNVSIQG